MVHLLRREQEGLTRMRPLRTTKPSNADSVQKPEVTPQRGHRAKGTSLPGIIFDKNLQAIILTEKSHFYNFRLMKTEH